MAPQPSYRSAYLPRIWDDIDRNDLAAVPAHEAEIAAAFNRAADILQEATRAARVPLEAENRCQRALRLRRRCSYSSRCSGSVDARLDRLKRTNRGLGASRSVEQAIERDNEFHLELVAECPEWRALDLIRQFMERTKRYELALMRG